MEGERCSRFISQGCPFTDFTLLRVSPWGICRNVASVVLSDQPQGNRRTLGVHRIHGYVYWTAAVIPAHRQTDACVCAFVCICVCERDTYVEEAAVV